MKEPKQLPIIGRTATIEVCGIAGVSAKVDTGADSSSIWASHIQEQQAALQFTLFDTESEYYNGEVITLHKPSYRTILVANSFGTKERRYVVKLPIRYEGRKIRATFTLANRATKTYPILLGRRLLHNKFLVDVTQAHSVTTTKLPASTTDKPSHSN